MTVGFFFIFGPLSVVTLILDVIHTVYFMYKLIVGKYRDGAGRFVSILSCRKLGYSETHQNKQG